jgi:hypothetical protein
MSQQLSGNPSMLLPKLSQRWQSFAGPADIESSAPLIPRLEPPRQAAEGHFPCSTRCLSDSSLSGHGQADRSLQSHLLA